MDHQAYSTALKVSYLTFIVPTVLVFVTALLSVKEMGGTLGAGLKKIGGGSVIDTALVMTFLALEQGRRGLLSDSWIQGLFLAGGIFGSVLLISGFYQVYKVAKKYKLFTP